MPQRSMEAVREDETFTITDLAAEFGVTPRAIQFYEGEGLIEPARQGQNRVYSRRDRARLAWILRGKNVGFSLAEIKEILDLYHAGDGRVRQRERTLELCRRQIGVLTNQRNDIDATLAELQEFVAVVEGLLPSNAKSGES